MDEELLRGKALEPEGGEIAAFDGFPSASANEQRSNTMIRSTRPRKRFRIWPCLMGLKFGDSCAGSVLHSVILWRNPAIVVGGTRNCWRISLDLKSSDGQRHGSMVIYRRYKKWKK